MKLRGTKKAVKQANEEPQKRQKNTEQKDMDI